MENDSVNIIFRDGTLILEAPENTELPLSNWCVFDKRCGVWRAPAANYAPILLFLHRNHINYKDHARAFERLQLPPPQGRTPRDYQLEALNAWKNAGRRGIVVLPTGTGKSFLAQLAIADAARYTLVAVPTIDLMTQWASQLESAFNMKVGMLGGGSRDIGPLTVATYDSALLSMEFTGARFGMLVVDECHHLPGPAYRNLALSSIAPFRLGLSATPERDGDCSALENLLGPVVYRKDILEMDKGVLANYSTERIWVDMDEEDFTEYKNNREIYLDFLRRNNINVSAQAGWSNFIAAAARLPGGREAMKSYLTQKRLAIANKAKLAKVRQLLLAHNTSRIIIFTADNNTAYLIGERFLLPVLTHHTKAAERKDFLERFRSGEYPVLVTSKVLNEGVDVPEADVAIVVSGSASTREHIQRLGRILRPVPGKNAVLYELISLGTAEFSISERRRQSSAYERTDY